MSSIGKGFVWDKSGTRCWIVKPHIAYHKLCIYSQYNLPASWDYPEMEVMLRVVEEYLDGGNIYGD